MSKGRPPDIAIKDWPVDVAAWRQTGEDGRFYWNAKVSKSYKDRETGAYNSTESLSEGDWLKAAALLQELHRRIRIEDRGSQAEQGKEAMEKPSGKVPF